jgi:hypothetical protein
MYRWKSAERQETTHSGPLAASYISNDLKANNDPILPPSLMQVSASTVGKW